MSLFNTCYDSYQRFDVHIVLLCIDPFASFLRLLNKRIFDRRPNCNNSYWKWHAFFPSEAI